MLTFFKRENVGICHNSSDILTFPVHLHIFMKYERNTNRWTALCKRILCKFNQINELKIRKKSLSRQISYEYK